MGAFESSKIISDGTPINITNLFNIIAASKLKICLFPKRKPKTPIEKIEDIEILRFLELGINVKMLETYGTTQAVDIPEDVDKVLEILNERKS